MHERSKINVALIGYGYWGQKLFDYIQSDTNYDLQAVFFRQLAHLDPATIKQKYGPYFIGSLDTLLTNDSIEAVIIATPIDTHYELAKTVLLSNKHVLVEKPLALQVHQCQELVNIAKERQLYLETEYTFTYSQALSRAKQLVDSGVIGQIEAIHIEKKQLGRFLDFDVYTLLGTHCLSMLDIFLPISACEYSSFPLIEDNQQVTAAIVTFKELKSACRGYIDLSLHSPKKSTKLVVFGRDGTLTYEPMAQQVLQYTVYDRVATRGRNKVDVTEYSENKFDEGNNLRYALANFFDVLTNVCKDNKNRSAAITKVVSRW